MIGMSMAGVKCVWVC